MLWPAILSGFMLGAAGSLHCVGMCGPLSLALPTFHFSKKRKFLSLLLYQSGRILTYSLLGFLFGWAGRSLYLTGMQQWFSMALGIVVVLLAVLYFVRHQTIHVTLLNRFYHFIRVLISRLLKSAGGSFGFFLVGIANGFLPCGMVYIAIAATLSFSSISHSVVFMALFGAGTLPAMMLVGYAGQLVGPGAREYMRKAVPFIITLLGAVLILRGLNLGIPFISPRLPEAVGLALSCHP